MWVGFEVIQSGLGLGIEHIILIVVMLSGLILASKDFKLTLLWWFVTSGCCFVWFYEWGLVNSDILWQPSIAVFCISLVLLALTLYNVSKNPSASGGGFV